MTGEELLAEARKAARRAYAPYSGFQVGAALLAQTGEVFTACNVENASYGLSLCAERSAVACAVAAGRRRFVAVAVACGSEGASSGQPCLPCGACLQVLAEFSPEMVVWVEADGSDVPDGTPRPSRSFRLDELMPHRFHLKS